MYMTGGREKGREGKGEWVGKGEEAKQLNLKEAQLEFDGA